MKEIYIPTTGPPGARNGPHARGMPWKLEEGSQKLEARSPKLEARSLKLEASPEGNRQFQVSGDSSVVLCVFSVNSVVKKSTPKSHKETGVRKARDPADVHIRDGTFLREKIPKPPYLNRTGEGGTYTVNNRKTGLNRGDMNFNSVVLCEASVYSVVKKDLNAKDTKKTQRAHEKNFKNSAVLCVYSVISAVKNRNKTLKA